MQGAGRKLQKAEFLVADMVEPDWTRKLTSASFDCVLLLAVLHHIPGGDVRTRILRQARELLAPQGRIVVSTWQFMDNERMQKKIVPWSVAGIDERELEPGDTLLNWKRGGMGLRYCHWISEDEMLALAVQAGLNIMETFRTGGREGNLSLYGVLSVS
jgi:tRNA (uracil-5-)-methyltransferase TRM9